MDKIRAEEIIKGFKAKRVLVVGDVMLDLFITGTVDRINPEAPVPILRARSEKLLTGGAGNCAKNIASLGGQATLLSVVGEDVHGKKVAEMALAEKYSAVLVPDSGRPTIRKMRYLVQSQQMLRVDYEETSAISGAAEEALIKHLKEAAAKADAILVSDYAKGVLTPKVAAAILEAAREHNLPVAADVKLLNAKLFVGVSLVKPNLKEGCEILGLDSTQAADIKPEEVAQRVGEKMRANVFLTLGAKGMMVLGENGVVQYVPQEHRAEVFDLSGAGDTAIAALVLARLCGARDVEAAQIANAACAVEVSTAGNIGVTQEELFNMIEHKHA